MIRKSTDCATGAGGGPGNGFADGVQEHYLSILRGVNWPEGGPGPSLRTLGVTSCESGEGVSTVAARLAIAAACCGSRQVLLVDANLAEPAAKWAFAAEPGPGLVEVLGGQVEPAQAIQPTHVANLSILAAGARGNGAARAYDSPRLAELVGVLKQTFPLSVFDLPAAGEASSALRLAGLLDGVLLVVEAERVPWEAAERVAQRLLRGNARLLGAVLNKRRRYVPSWLDRYL